MSVPATFTPRPPFASLPPDVVAALTAELGSPIVAADDRQGGITGAWELSHDRGATWQHDFDLVYTRD